MELPIALAAAESLGDCEQLVWAAFLDAVAALRVRLWEPPPYRFVVGPYTAVDRWLAVRLAEAGREVAVVAIGRDGGAGPARRPTSPGGGAGDTRRRHLEQGARLDRFDAHARLGWGGAVALIDGAAGGSAVGLAVAAYRHHRRMELRTLHPVGAEPPWTASADLEGLPPVS